MIPFCTGPCREVGMLPEKRHTALHATRVPWCGRAGHTPSARVKLKWVGTERGARTVCFSHPPVG